MEKAKIFLKIGVMILAVLILGVTGKKEAKAQEHTVSDEEALKTAITAATSGDVIALSKDITVSSQVAINKSLTIDGRGYQISVIEPGLLESGVLNSQNSRYRVFQLSGSGSEVIIRRITILGGNIQGGAVYVNSGVKASFEKVNILRSGGTSSTGGGLYNAGTLIIKNSNINRNAANYGGGFLNTGTMVIENCSFSENRSLSTSGGGGAGENQGPLYINNSTFANNKSTELGGAINDVRGFAYVMNSTFTGNVAFGSYDGGAFRGSTTVVVNSLLAYNYDGKSGGTYTLDDVWSRGNWTNNTALSNYRLVSSLSQENDLSTLTNYNNVHYTGLTSGSDNSLFTAGSLASVLSAEGEQISGDMVFQPMLYKLPGEDTPIISLKEPISELLTNGAKTAFDPFATPTPVFAYYNENQKSWYNNVNGSWTTIDEPTDAIVVTDQLGGTRGNVIGGTSQTVPDLNMIKLVYDKDTAHGTVHGITIYGDAYLKGSKVYAVTTPDPGYKFVQWNRSTPSGDTLYSTDNPLTITVMEDLDLYPVYEEGEGETPVEITLNPVQVDGDSYIFSGTITVEGDDDGGREITLYITDSDGKIVHIETVTTDENGNFIFEAFTPDIQGVYEVYVTSSGDENISDELEEGEPINALGVDPDVTWQETVEVLYGTRYKDIVLPNENAVQEGSFSFKGVEENALVGDVGSYVVQREFTPSSMISFNKVTKGITIKVTPKALDKSMVVVPSDCLYTGAEQRPEAVVTDGNPSIISPSDYSVSYSDNKEVGTAELIVTANTKDGNYFGQTVVEFNIVKRPLSNTLINAISPLTYNGKEQEPEISFIEAEASIIKDTDYKVDYSDNKNAGTGAAIVTATEAGNYTGSAKVTFVIEQKPLSEDMINDISAVEYNGLAHKPVISVTDGEPGVISEDDYTISYGENINAGKGTVTITAKVDGNYKGEAVKEFDITRKPLDDTMIGTINAVGYDGTSHKPIPVVSDGSPSIIGIDDYSVSYGENKNAGKGSVTITAKEDGNYAGTAAAAFDIGKRPLTNTMLKAIDPVVYNGQEQKPTVLFADAEAGIINSTDYAIDYTGNVASGTGKATVTAKTDGNYSGECYVEFLISKRDIKEVNIDEIKDVMYTGKEQKPEVIITDGEPSIIKDLDYDIDYSKNIDVGEATVTISAKRAVIMPVKRQPPSISRRNL